MCREYKKFWAGRYRYKQCDFCGEKKAARGIGYEEVDVMSQCWDCHVEQQNYPVSLEAILFREVQEYLKEKDICVSNTTPCTVVTEVEVVDTRAFVNFCADRCDDCATCDAAWKEFENLENLRNALHLELHNSQNREWHPNELKAHFLLEEIREHLIDDDHDGRHGASCSLCCP